MDGTDIAREAAAVHARNQGLSTDTTRPTRQIGSGNCNLSNQGNR